MKNAQSKRAIAVEEAIDYAIAHDTFQVYYQPIYSSNTKTVTSCEALLRLTDKNLGPINPEEIIPVSEENGKIIQIGLIVLEDACKFVTDQQIKSTGIEYVQVNISVIQCIQVDFVQRVTEITEKYNVKPNQICFEITETLDSQISYVMNRNINELHTKGYLLALDDYGRGFANMDNLLRYPFNFIKLDKSMVWASFSCEKTKIAVESTVSMVKRLDMKIIAEGVETYEQVQELLLIQCDFLQGYYFSRPVAKDQLLEKLKAIG